MSALLSAPRSQNDEIVSARHVSSRTNGVLASLAFVGAATLALGAYAQEPEPLSSENLGQIVDRAVQPIIGEHAVPGLAVAVTVQGKQYIFNYGVASRESAQEVTDETIFEIGSISKTFTATLAAYGEASGALALSDMASKHLPALSGTSFDQISLLDLGTYVAGGLPLQFPDEVADQQTMIDFYRSWQPDYPPGTRRLYSNPSLGLFGHLAARSMGGTFDQLSERELFPRLGLTSTFIDVPDDRMSDYAYGYSKEGKPIRVNPGVLDSETYGVKTTAADLIRFVEANMDSSGLDDTLRRAIATTHTGYYRVGGMVQGLGWEMYADPTDLEALLAGNSTDIVLKANEVARLDPPLPPQAEALINKTGSTNGFGAYVAFVPAKDIGVAMLANKNYPVPARVKAAHQILTALDDLVD